MRGSMGGRELDVIMALVLSVTGHLGGRRSSAGCGGRRCCGNMLRELASFVSHCPTQLQLRVFVYTKTAVKSQIHQKVPANCCPWPVTHRPVSVFSKKIWKYLVGYNSIRSRSFIWAVLTAVSQIHTFLNSDITPRSITL